MSGQSRNGTTRCRSLSVCRTADADAFYHRAVYGAWTANADARVLETRLELADYLAKKGTSRGLLAELLILQDQASSDPALARRVAALLLEAGSPARAAALYRELLKNVPRDAEVLTGLGRAELAAGDYRNSTAAFIDLVRKAPGNADAAHWLQLSAQLSRLDPTPRNLSSAEKHSRSMELLARTVAALERCAPADELLEPARALLQTPVKARRPPANEQSEAAIETAIQVWHERERSCSTRPSPEDPLAILMKKVSE